MTLHVLRRLLQACFLATLAAVAISSSASDEPQPRAGWDTDGMPTVGPTTGVTVGSPLPDMGPLRPDGGANTQSVAVGASADMQRTPQSQPDDAGSSTFGSAGGLDALPGINEDRDFNEATTTVKIMDTYQSFIHDAPTMSSTDGSKDPVFSDAIVPEEDTVQQQYSNLLRRESKSAMQSWSTSAASAAQGSAKTPQSVGIDDTNAILEAAARNGPRKFSADTANAFQELLPTQSSARTMSDSLPNVDSRADMREMISSRGGGREKRDAPVREHSFKDDPRLSPEAIFANKQIAPEVAEFLGHLAQRTRVSRKEESRAAQAEAGLAQGTVRHVMPGDEEDADNDDIEDMKRAAARVPKRTALSHFFEQLDSKTSAATWLPRDCASLAQNITDKYAKMSGRSGANWATAGPAGAGGRSEIHTGMFFKHWGLGKEAARKLRLGVLSFLATQDAGKVKLHIWTDQEKSGHMLKEMLGPISHHPEFMDAINISVFDHKAEFAKVAPTLARQTLTELYQKDPMPNLRPDLFRSIILYNYGGMWMDADTMLMQDVSPLLGEDWAYLVRGKGGVEGALLSASRPQSHFSTAYLIALVMREPPLDGEPQEQRPLLAEVFEKDPSHTTLHLLPPCFFDSDPEPQTTAVLSSDASVGSPFFGNKVSEAYRAYFSMGIEDASKDSSTTDVSVLQDPSTSLSDVDDDDDKSSKAAAAPVWAYHWRSNFGSVWARGSLADVAERTFMKRLGMKIQH